MSSDDVSRECQLLLKLLSAQRDTTPHCPLFALKLRVSSSPSAKRTDQNFKRETREGEDVDNFLLLVITRPENYALDYPSIVGTNVCFSCTMKEKFEGRSDLVGWNCR